MDRTPEFWIRELELLPHPEGGFYREVYRSDVLIDKHALPFSFKGARYVSTSIYYLLEKGDFSAFHRIASDELWHFYAGRCLEIFEILPDGALIVHRLGNDPSSGEHLQVIIRAGNWFASRPAVDTDYSLVGCTVAPGFDFEDFEMADRDALVEQYPQHEVLIQKLTRK